MGISSIGSRKVASNINNSSIKPISYSFKNIDSPKLEKKEVSKKLMNYTLLTNFSTLDNSKIESNTSFDSSDKKINSTSNNINSVNSDLEEAIKLSQIYSSALETPEVSDIIEKINKKSANDENSILNLITIAINELGNTENFENQNWNKYAEYFKNYPGFYSADKQNVAWCDIFVDWLFLSTFGEDRARELTNQFERRNNGAGVDYSLLYYGFATGNTPKTGAQIFFKDSNSLNHTGMVVTYDSEYVYVIEGNTLPQAGQINPEGVGVYLKKYKIDDPRIAAYGYPNFDDSEKLTPSDEKFIHDNIVDLYDSIFDAANDISNNQFKNTTNEEVTMYDSGFVQNTINRFKYTISFIKPFIRTVYDDAGSKIN